MKIVKKEVVEEAHLQVKREKMNFENIKFFRNKKDWGPKKVAQDRH